MQNPRSGEPATADDPRPAVVAMIASPLQALNLVEYANATGAKPDLVLVGDGVVPERTVPQIRRVLEALPTARLHVRRTDGWSAGRPHWWGEMFSEVLLQTLALGRPIDRVIVGDIRLPAAFQLSRVLGLRPDQVTLLDDGMSTLAIDRRAGSDWERSLEASWSAPEPDDRAPRGITIFTAFAEALKAAPDDTVIVNDYSCLRSGLADLTVDPALVAVIGSPYSVPGGGLSTAADIRITLDLIRAAKARFPGARLIYAPHRRESAAKLALLRAEVEVREFEVPFEVAPLELGALPAALVGFRSSLLVNLAALYVDLPEIELISFRPPDEAFDAATARVHADAYDFLAQHTGGRVVVEPLPVDPDWALHRLDVPWRVAEAEPLTMTLAEFDAALSTGTPGYFAALLRTASADADAFCLVGGAGRWRPWLSESVGPGVRVLNEPGAAADLSKVVLYGGGDLPPDLVQLAATPDLRLFWEDADDATQEELLGLGFRLYAIDREGHRWERRTSADGAVDLLYAVRKDGTGAVSIVTHWGGLMGGQRSHVETVESLVRQGHMVDTVLPADQGLGGLLHQVGGTVTIVAPLAYWYHRSEEGASSSSLHVDDPGSPQPLLVQEFATRRPDVVMTQCGLTPHGALAATALGIPHIWYLREYGDLDLGYRLPGAPADVGEVVAALSTHVITNSRGVRDYFFPGRPEAATVVYPAPVIPGPHTVRTSWDERVPGTFTVGVLASLQPGKGQSTLIEAAAALRMRGVSLRVILYGEGWPTYRRALEEAAREQGVRDLVVFAGIEPSRLRMFTSLDAVVVASTAEAFGRVPFEAAAFDVPIVYADAAGPSEYMRDGVTGLAFTPGDAQALADAVERLARDAGLRERLAAEARADLVSDARRGTLDRQLHELVASAAQNPTPAPERQAWRDRLRQRLMTNLGLVAAGSMPSSASTAAAERTGSVRA